MSSKINRKPSLLEINTDRTMRLIADDIKAKCGDGYGFAVLIFPFKGDVKVAHYISNARSEDMIRALREKADVLEAGLDISDARAANSQKPWR